MGGAERESVVLEDAGEEMMRDTAVTRALPAQPRDATLPEIGLKVRVDSARDPSILTDHHDAFKPARNPIPLQFAAHKRKVYGFSPR